MSLTEIFLNNRISSNSVFNSLVNDEIEPASKRILITGDNVDFWLLLPSRVLLKKSGCKIPRIELEEMGPSLDLVMRRTHLASDDLYKRSLKQPKALKVCMLLPHLICEEEQKLK